MVVRSGMLSGGWGPTRVVMMVLWYQGVCEVSSVAVAVVEDPQVVAVSSSGVRVVPIIGIFFF